MQLQSNRKPKRRKYITTILDENFTPASTIPSNKLSLISLNNLSPTIAILNMDPPSFEKFHSFEKSRPFEESQNPAFSAPSPAYIPLRTSFASISLHRTGQIRLMQFLRKTSMRSAP
jgi:hypothetical protein